MTDLEIKKHDKFSGGMGVLTRPVIVLETDKSKNMTNFLVGWVSSPVL
ncbi:hypothetical protein [Nodularia sphaerocarpa]|nr:hypothetical protein [Nodularia sphaerocarpa]ULP70569.1 hypothetical protein BDGGKGIB_00185 [Nodularia sphaerocarpa UHCC 0038]